MITGDVWLHITHKSCLLLFDLYSFCLDDGCLSIFLVHSHSLDLDIAKVIIVFKLILLDRDLLWFWFLFKGLVKGGCLLG